MEAPTLQELSTLLTTPFAETLPKVNVRMRKIAASSVLMFSDLMTIAAAMFLSIAIRNIVLPGAIMVNDYMSVIPVIIPLLEEKGIIGPALLTCPPSPGSWS